MNTTEIKKLISKAYEKGFVDACGWDSPVTQDVDSQSFEWGQTDAVTAIIAEIERLESVEAEPVAWQFFEDGEWHFALASDYVRSHVESVGLPTRDLYPYHPPSIPEGQINADPMAIIYAEAASNQAGEIGNMLHNLSCETYDEGLSARLCELSSDAWNMQRRLDGATQQMPAAPNSKGDV